MLPCSKTDVKAVKALGKTRSWGCVCTVQPQRDQHRELPCPYHALAEQEKTLHTLFIDDKDVPIFCTSAGKPVTKAKVVDTFERINAMLGRPIVDHSGAKLYGGHSLRVTGAQWMASIGLPLISIQLMARWDSDVVTSRLLM